MYLKTLTMKGFKSFADSVDLELEPGVTVVVGPNGSGKSNVVDAIAWVLGAQAPSSVRSQKMDDVIFAGSANRPALGRAEVSLTIDNSDGLLPTEFNEVQLTRTLFRNGDSEYSMNGVPCRLLDIQDLLSDSGVGRTQHVIVSQGQIDAVLNARPEERRLIIEEAAGVLKFRKRREKAQRRLHATEANLTRVKDLLREVRRQLRPLEKQADAARRHGDVVAELQACQRYLAGRQVDSLRAKLTSHREQRNELASRNNELRSLLATLDAEIIAIESDLSAQGAVDLGDALVVLEGLNQRARGADDLLAERLTGIQRERQATVDGDVLAALRADAGAITEQLTEVDAASASLAPEFAELERDEASLADDRSSLSMALASAKGDAAEAAAAGRAAEVRGELAALRGSAEAASTERGGVQVRLDALGARRTELVSAHAEHRTRLEAAVAHEASLVEAADAAAAARDAGEARLQRIRDERAEAEAALRSADARVQALADALRAARAAAGAEELGGLDGVVGTILDVVAIEPGFELAVEAALGSVVSAVLVADPANARAALDRFADGPGVGAVISLIEPTTPPAPVTSPDSIARRVTAERADVAALLRRLLADVDVVDGSWADALDRSLAANGRVVVTRTGDRIGGDVWQIGRVGVGATQAALDEATAVAAEARAARDALDIELTDQGDLMDELRQVAVVAAHALDDNDAELTASTEAVQFVEAQLQQLDIETDALSGQRDELEHRATRESARVRELEALLPGLEAAEVESAERGRELEATRSDLDRRGQALHQRRTDLEVRAAAADERRGVLRRRLADVEDRLQRLASDESEGERRRLVLDRTEALTEHLRGLLEGVRADLGVHLGVRQEERRQQSAAVQSLTAALDTKRRARVDAETELREIGERTGRIDIEEAETRTRLETTTEMIRRDLDLDPDAAAATPLPELADGITPAARARELERDLKLMGPINPLALQEFEALQERHEFLNDQLEDIRVTRRDLNKVIKAIDEEIVTVFAAAYADVADNFTHLFERLFPGGAGSLTLTEPSNLLETGIEVSAKPSGKNVKKLSLLSGGERALTALAFLFAVFRSRPSPFYVMDEVEAALDDVNLHRFLGLIEEFREEAQLIIVSHQKRTMEAADSLYGVTMEQGGSSTVLSERSDVERTVAPAAARQAELATS